MPAPLPRTIESLEPRIAPANLVISNLGKTAKWTDVDGDLVTLTSSKPILDELDFVFLPQETGDVGFQLALLDISNEAAQGASLTFVAKRDPVAKVGDGFVNVGWLNAFGSDLAAIVIPGDLARLDVGDANPATMALGRITTTTGGNLGGLTQDATLPSAPNLDWAIYGRLGAMTVKGDFGANLIVFGSENNAAAGSIGTISILGDVYGNNPALVDILDERGAGYIFASGAIGTVKIAGSLRGNAGEFSGSIYSASSITSVTIGRNVSGGSGDSSGHIFAEKTLGSVTIGGNLYSGSARDVEGTLTPSFAAGSIGSNEKIGSVKIRGDVFGGSSVFGGSIFTAGGSGGKIGTVTITGALAGGTDFFETENATLIVFNGIYSDSTIGAVKVGSLQGNSPVQPVQIVAKGPLLGANVTQAQALAIASVTVARGMNSAEILAGYNQILEAVSSEVQIGPVKVGNNVEGSSIAAGVWRGPDFFFGTADDAIVPSSNAQTYAKITSITVGGYLYGNTFATDGFAFQAQEIGAVKIGTTVIPVTVRSLFNGPDDLLFGVTHDFRIREL